MPDTRHARPAKWVAADWGTSNLRLWVMGENQQVLHAIEDPRGMGALTPEGYEPVLRDLLAPWLSSAPLTMVACGMVGARQGWIEAPYARVPAPPPCMAQAIRAPSGPDLRVMILPGMAQDDPPDVMRGEETQAAGFLADHPDYEGVLVLPGTHNKWMRLSGGRIESFRTAMTGELFAVLRQHSVLRHSASGGWDAPTFDSAASAAAKAPESALTSLFGVRAASLLTGQGPAESTARLSGTLIGAEVGALRALWQGAPVTLLGNDRLSALYARTLRSLGAEPQIADASATTLRGLARAYHQLETQP